ncbi:holin [Streptomyces sp. NPDC050504]|uniref:holin n=1 Tax=Streptomyces sp. NPDC050504 TaxID=3365618 RepID=UPI003794A872
MATSSELFEKKFWIATTERAIRTFAQSLAAVLLAGASTLLDVEWTAALATAGLATLLAVLTAVGASQVGPSGPGLAETVRSRLSPAPATGAEPVAAPAAETAPATETAPTAETAPATGPAPAAEKAATGTAPAAGAGAADAPDSGAAGQSAVT